MRIEFDPVKSALNAEERDLPFDLAAEFDFATAIIWQDLRRPYPENRYLALGLLASRLHILCFITISDGIRVISLRKANVRERKRYETLKTTG